MSFAMGLGASLRALSAARLGIQTASQNIANVNTPGYKAVDVEPFEQVLDKTRVTLQATQVGHLRGGATGDSFSVKTNSDDVAMMPSENSVVLENELMNAGEISRSFELNTAIVKAFHRMVLMTVRT